MKRKIGLTLALLLTSMALMTNLPIETKGTLDIEAENSNISLATPTLNKDSFSLLHNLPPQQWSKSYGGEGAEYASALVKRAYGGYAMAGYTNSFGAGENDFWLVETDSSGNKLWDKTYGGTNDDKASALIQTSEGGYALAGYTNSFGAGDYDFWLVKTDSYGNKLWDKTYGKEGIGNTEIASALIQTSDGGYAMAGFACPTLNQEAFWLVKTDAFGIQEWNKTYTRTGYDDDYACALVQTTDDGGYAIAGYGFTAEGADTWLVKTDSSGNKLWDKTYGGTGFDEAYTLVQTNDGGYAMAGSTTSLGAGAHDFWLFKTDSSGNKLWDKTYGGTQDDVAYSLIKTSDGGYALAGEKYTYVVARIEAWLVKTDSSGNEQWNKTYGGPADDAAYALVKTDEAGYAEYALAGYTLSYCTGASDFWLVRTGVVDSDGDGLFDNWETDGIDSNNDGTIDLILPGANPKYKDIYLEIDYMDSTGTSHDHNPDTNAINDVVHAFKKAPVGNPNGSLGMALHIVVDESIPHQNVVIVWDGFDSIKSTYFGTATQRSDPNSANILEAKRWAYRYCLFIHQYSTYSTTTTSSGIAELPGNDFIVSLGAFDYNKGTRDQQAGTLMHELGHTLNLRHGGGDNINGKPNYFSIMSYTFQFNDLVSNRPLDYSWAKWSSLDENSLNEKLGVNGPSGWQTIYGLRDPNTGSSVVYSIETNRAIDWNTDSDKDDTSVARSVNFFSSYGDNALNVLESHNDWANLQYDFRGTPEYADGAHGNVSDQCITLEILEMIRNIIVNPIPDVAVVSVTPYPTSVTQGNPVTIAVVVKNEGDFSQGFSVTSYYDNTAISSQSATILAPGGLRTLNFIWNTAGVSIGTHTIKAMASIVPGETDTTDNIQVDGTVFIEAAPPEPPPSRPVGGTRIPIDKLSLLAPWIGLASIIIAVPATIIYVKRVKRRKEKQ